MTDKLAEFRMADAPLPERNRLWPLYGAGFENLGLDGKPIDVPFPTYGPDELLVRHDACGLCFSDIKVIKLGEEHPRIYRDMKANPITLGHEIAMTVVGVGENLRDQYNVGDRFTIQADVFVDGTGYAYGYEIQGGLSRYNVIDQRVLNGDDGNYLIPVQPDTGYVESALTEPWACVTAAYGLTYRTSLKPGGTTWIIGPGDGDDYTISDGFDSQYHPGRLLLSDVPERFAAWLKEQAAALGIEVFDAVDVAAPPVEQVDDIVLLSPDPELIETVSPHLSLFGVVALLADGPLSRKVNVDIGRVHYNRWVYVGTRSHDVARAYADVPVRSSLMPGGRALFVGAGGPMGRMHAQRAIEVAGAPSVMVCSDVSDLRLNDLRESYADEAAAKGIEFICLNPMEKESYDAGMARFEEGGFDDIIVLAPVPVVIADAARWLAPRGVMNVFAGVARGTTTQLDLGDTYLKDARVIGHSASTIDDLRLMLHQAESGELSPNRSLAAVGSLDAACDGLAAVRDTVFPGKVVIFPNIKDLPLTSLQDLKTKLPTVYALLKDEREWTVEAEAEFLRLMLP
ncbi:MAG: alcohol dehydrogenase catalytic domain-containing protein [Caldilineae bacterium]|nr:alcohol dehydrogenase catalytic domain-containing protein [Caldilineae bacterium]